MLDGSGFVAQKENDCGSSYVALEVPNRRYSGAEARSLVRQRAEIEEAAEAALHQHRDYQILRQIPGIGPINAMAIIAEAGDIRRFGQRI